MNRRTLLAGCVASVATPFAALSEPAGRIHRIGSLTRGGRKAAAPYNDALEEGLRALGWVEGRNVVFEHRYADLKPERYPELAAELVGLGVDIVVAPSTPAALAVKQATATIPIVTIVAVDPVGAGLVASLARPGGNVTGLTNDTGPELGAKLLQLLKEAVPRINRAAVLRETSSQPGLAPYLPGGLMAYSADIVDLYRRAAIYIDKILEGAKASDLPMEQPTKFELTMPPMLARLTGTAP